MSKNKLKNHIDKYLIEMENNNYSEDTLISLRKELGYFIKFLGKEKKIERYSDVTEEIIKEYNTKLRKHIVAKTGKPYTTHTLAGKLQPVRSFFAWLTKNLVILYDPAKDMEIPSVKKGLPRNILSQEEIRKFIEMPRTDTVMGYRDRTMFELFYATGIRNIEMRKLKVKDVDLEKGMIRIKEGKGRKERYIPLTRVASGFLKEYINVIRPRFLNGEQHGDHLFLTLYGKQIWRRGICDIFRRYAKQSDVGKPVTAHAIRHSIAMHLLENGMNVRYIQDFLGHGSLQTTQLYSKVTMKGLRKNYNKCHPKEKRMRVTA